MAQKSYDPLQKEWTRQRKNALARIRRYEKSHGIQLDIEIPARPKSVTREDIVLLTSISPAKHTYQRARPLTELERQWYKEADLARKRYEYAARKTGQELPDVIPARPEVVTRQDIEYLQNLRPLQVTDAGVTAVVTPEQLQKKQESEVYAPRETDIILREIFSTLSSMANDSPANADYAKVMRRAFNDMTAKYGEREVAETARAQHLLEETRIILGYSDVDKKRTRLNGFLFALMNRPLTAEESKRYTPEIQAAMGAASDQSDIADYDITQGRGAVPEPMVKTYERMARSILKARGADTRDTLYNEVFDAIMTVLVNTNGNRSAAEDEAARYWEEE